MDTYAQRVRELEAEGLTTSDAQGAADVELGYLFGRRYGPLDRRFGSVVELDKETLIRIAPPGGFPWEKNDRRSDVPDRRRPTGKGW